jgi:hypothetical protein
VSVPKGAATVWVACVDKNDKVLVKNAAIADGAASTYFGTATTTRAAATRASFVSSKVLTTDFTEDVVKGLIADGVEFNEESVNSEIVQGQTYLISSDKTVGSQFNGDNYNNPLSGTTIIITDGATATITQRLMEGVNLIVYNGTAKLGSGVDLGAAGTIVIFPDGTLTNESGSSNNLCELYNYGTVDANGELLHKLTYNDGLFRVNTLTDATWAGGNDFVNNGKLIVEGAYTAKSNPLYNNCYAQMGSATITGLQNADGAHLRVSGLVTWANDIILGSSSIVEIGQLCDNLASTWGCALQAPTSVTSDEDNAYIKIGYLQDWNYNNPYYRGHYTIDVDDVNSSLGDQSNQYSTIAQFYMNALGYVYDQYQTIHTDQSVTFTEFNVTAPTGDDCHGQITYPSTPTPETYDYVYYAYEDLGSIGDFDFNDVVLRVSYTANEGEAKVEVVAAGGTYKVGVYYGGTALCEDVHAAFDDDNPVNVGVRAFNTNYPTATIQIGSTPIHQLYDLQIQVANDSGTSLQLASTVVSAKNEMGSAPQCLIIPAGWKWPMEYCNICWVYATEDFSIAEWVGNTRAANDWYLHPAAAYASKVFEPK